MKPRSGYRGVELGCGPKGIWSDTLQRSNTQKINIWAGFSSMGTFPLCIFDENLTAALFVKILEEHLLEQGKVFHQDEWFIVQNNDPKHTAKHIKAWMGQFMDKNRIDWPSQSPELNPIENLFAWIKLELIKRKPKTKKELIVELTNVWAGIDGFFLHSYWNSQITNEIHANMFPSLRWRWSWV